MATNINYSLSSTSTSHYTTELSQYETETESFPGIAGDGEGFIKAIAVNSAENRAWYVEIYDVNDVIIYAKSFSESDGIQIDNVTYYYFAETEIPIPLTRKALVIGLRNMSTDAKTVGTDGAVTLTLTIAK